MEPILLFGLAASMGVDVALPKSRLRYPQQHLEA
jgi:hypothetical protein